MTPKFTTPCFIRKNTPELRKKLEDLGYKYGGKDLYNPNMLYCNDGIYWEVLSKPARDVIPIDCGTNEELFLAIAALRDDSNKGQWFVMDVEVYLNISKGMWFKATDINGGKHVGTQIDPMCCHEATVKELIEHFKE